MQCEACHGKNDTKLYNMCGKCRAILIALKTEFGLHTVKAMNTVIKAKGDYHTAIRMTEEWLAGACNLSGIEIEDVMVSKTTGKRVRKPRKPVVIDPKKLTEAEYKELEFTSSREFVGGYTNEEHLRFLSELLDVALLASDIDWARKLHIQIRMIKEHN